MTLREDRTACAVDHEQSSCFYFETGLKHSNSKERKLLVILHTLAVFQGFLPPDLTGPPSH